MWRFLACRVNYVELWGVSESLAAQQIKEAPERLLGPREKTAKNVARARACATFFGFREPSALDPWALGGKSRKKLRAQHVSLPQPFRHGPMGAGQMDLISSLRFTQSHQPTQNQIC